MFDSHCHVTDIGQPDRVLHEALQSGVTSLLTAGYDSASNARVLLLRQRYPGLLFALGLHPWHAADEIAPVLSLIEAERPDAVGEVGLDAWDDPELPSLGRQISVLVPQLELAVRLDLPATLHSRKAVDELWGVVKSFPGLRGALHAFGGSLEQAKPFVDRGFFIGIGGGVTRARARRLRRVAAELPLESLLVETDAPAVGMEGVEPPNVRPAHLPRVVAALAELRGISADAVARVTDENAVRLLGPKAAVHLRSILAAAPDCP